MAIFRFMKGPKPQKFEYLPRFYDPEKEDLRRRIAESAKGGVDATSAMKSRISNTYRRRSRGIKGNIGRKKTFRSNMILLGTLMAILFLTYLFIEKYLPQIVNLVE